MQFDFRSPTRPQTTPPLRQHAQTYASLTFRATCDATAMYVLVRSQPRGVHVLSSLDRCGDDDDEWQVSLRLPRGRYRYRYFVELSGALVQMSPAEVEHRPVAMRRFDATLYVGDQLRATRRNGVRHRLDDEQSFDAPNRMTRSPSGRSRREEKCNRDARAGTGLTPRHNGGRGSATPH